MTPFKTETKLRQLLITHFNDDEFKTICFDLDVDYDSLGGEGKEGKSRELIAHLMRSDNLSRLTKHIRFLRPNVNWDAELALIDLGNQRYEFALNRYQIYEMALRAAEEGTVDNPVRRVKIYAPLGFTGIDDAKERWLSGLKQLVIQRRVRDVEAIYGIPDDKIMLSKAANFLLHYFYYAPSEADTALLRKHMFMRGIRLGGEGLGVPRGFGVLVVEDRLVLIAYSMSRGDEIVQQATAIRDKEVVKGWSDWFSGHAYVSGCLFDLQDYKSSADVGLYERLRELLAAKGLLASAINHILGEKLLGFDEVKTYAV